MLMYVHNYDKYEKLPEENPTLGILLYKKKDDANINASEYQLYLPDKKELQKKLKEWIEEGTDLLNAHVWLQIGYKNSETTEKNNIFKKYDNRKP